LGNISLGTQYASAVDEKPNPMSTCAAMRRYMLCEPGAMAEPTNDTTQHAIMMSLRAWKVSEAEEMMGASTACTSARALGTHVCAGVLCRLSPMFSSYTQTS
jgi:hypothetical protein